MILKFEDTYLGDPALLDEISDDELLYGGHILQLSAFSAYLGNKGAVCTLTMECQRNCN